MYGFTIDIVILAGRFEHLKNINENTTTFFKHLCDNIYNNEHPVVTLSRYNCTLVLILHS